MPDTEVGCHLCVSWCCSANGTGLAEDTLGYDLSSATSRGRQSFRESSGQSPLLYNLMMSQLWQHLCQHTGSGDGSREKQWIPPAFLLGEGGSLTSGPCSENSVFSVSPWCPLSSPPGSGSQSKQVRHHESSVADTAP